MENLNAETVKKALELCSNNDECVGEACPYYKTGCEKNMPKDALALVKELTEENERLLTYLDEHSPKCIYQYDGDVQEYCVLGPCGQFKTVADFQKQIEADTVRKMQERLKEYFPYDADSGLYVVLDQIAKETVESANG